MKMKNIITILMISTFLLFSINCYGDQPQPDSKKGQNYYVSPKGKDSNNGLSENQPFKTPQKVADLTKPGDTVYFMDGLYLSTNIDRGIKINNSGTADAWITYKAMPGAKPIIKQIGGWDHIIIKASYILIDGLNVEGNSAAYTQKEAEEAYERCITAKNAGRPIDYNSIAQYNTNGIDVTGRELRPAGLEVPHHVTIRNCEISYCPGGGIATMESDWILIENNRVHNNCAPMMWAGSGISIFHSMDVDTNVTDYKNIVRNNIVYRNQTNIKWIDMDRYSDGNGIIIDDNKNAQISFTPYKGRTLVENNICYENGGSGIHGFSSSNVDIIHNTVYNNGRNPDVNYPNIFLAACINSRLVNNISVATDGKNSSDDGNEQCVYANNIYFGGIIPENLGINDRVINPQFVNLWRYDFHLRKNSPAIDTATPSLKSIKDYEGNVRPQGAESDVGAHESAYTSETPLSQIVDFAALMTPKQYQTKKGKSLKGTVAVDD
jgi:parallel beta-helix repeat protein